MLKRLLTRLREAMARPFRDAARINREVLFEYLRDLRGTLLEIGPGSAPLLAGLRDSGEIQKIVIELPQAISHCRKLGYRCLAQDAGRERWALDDESVDVVVSSQVLEHIPDTDHVMGEARRVLRTGGKFLVSVPNQAALAYIVLMLLTISPPMNMVSDKCYGLGNPLSSRRWQKVPQFGPDGHAHLRLFATRAMNDLLTVYGFRVIDNHGGTWGIPLLGRSLAKHFPYYGLLTIVLAEKQDR